MENTTQNTRQEAVMVSMIENQKPIVRDCREPSEAEINEHRAGMGFNAFRTEKQARKLIAS